MLSALSFYSAKEALVFTVYNHSVCHCSDPQPPNSGGACTRTKELVSHCSDPHPPNLGGTYPRIRGLVPDENYRNLRATALYILRVSGVMLSVRRPPYALLTAAERWV